MLSSLTGLNRTLTSLTSFRALTSVSRICCSSAAVSSTFSREGTCAVRSTNMFAPVRIARRSVIARSASDGEWTCGAEPFDGGGEGEDEGVGDDEDEWEWMSGWRTSNKVDLVAGDTPASVS